MKKYIYNEAQYEEILDYLAEQEELQGKSLDHLTPVVVDISTFLDSMDEMFKQYKKDDCLDRYHRDGHFFTVGKRDSAYVWSALDGAVHLWNSLHKEGDFLILDNYCTTGDTETFTVQYASEHED